MGHVFISYSRKDQLFVDSIVGKLEAIGLDIWIDRHDIKPGYEWRGQIVKAIETADSFTLMISPHSMDSKFVRQEIFVADDKDRFILSAFLVNLEVPNAVALPLAGLHRILFYEDSEAGYAALETALLEQQANQDQLTAPALPARRQAEIVLAEVKDDKQNVNVFALLLLLLGLNKENLTVILSEAGRIVLSLPIDPAYELKAMALNADKRLVELGVTSFRLDGDQSFVDLMQADDDDDDDNEEEEDDSKEQPENDETRARQPSPGKSLFRRLVGGIVILALGVLSFLIVGGYLPYSPPDETTSANTDKRDEQDEEKPVVVDALTLTPTSTPAPIITLTPTITTTALPCNQALFIEDVTIPDGERILAGETFIKTWLIENIGSCDWGTGYLLIPDSGFAAKTNPIRVTDSIVKPGGQVEVSVELTAPELEGIQESEWLMRSSEGEIFGFGDKRSSPLFVQIDIYFDGLLSGFVWEDTDGNAIKNGGEPFFENVTVELWIGDCRAGELLDTAVTDGKGNYRFSNLGPEIYCIFIDFDEPPFDPSAWYASKPEFDSGHTTYYFFSLGLNTKLTTLDFGIDRDDGVD